VTKRKKDDRKEREGKTTVWKEKVKLEILQVVQFKLALQ
jgi:hypothetical protein